MEVNDFRIGAEVKLSDRLSLDASIKAGNGFKPLVRVVVDSVGIADRKVGVQWRIVDLGDEELVVLKFPIGESPIAGEIRHLRGLKDDTFVEGNRRDMIDAGRLWLFQQPDDPENFRLNELHYTDDIVFTDDATGEETVFHKKAQGEIITRTTNGRVAVVVEYEAQTPNPTPEMMLVELGGEGTEDGGLIRLMIGAKVSGAEISVIPPR